MKIQHPAFSDIQHDVADSDAKQWIDAGWVPVAAACPTCGASGDYPCVTKSGESTEPHARRPK